MFDARYFAFATISALLVISPGATMAVVMESVLGEGRAAGLLTVVGVNLGNSTLALASALGMSIVFHTWPSTLEAVKVGGAGYLACLGLRGIWLAWRRQGEGRVTPPTRGEVQAPRRMDDAGRPASAKSGGRRPRAVGSLSRGIMTNLLNPPVILFYMAVLPQFIGPRDPFFARFLVLAGTHVGMSVAWLSCYALALGILADRFARPPVRRALEAMTGVVLLGLAVRMLTR